MNSSSEAFADGTDARRDLRARLVSDVAAVPMVLCNAGYYGTLAAVRSLGRQGIPTITVDSPLVCAGRWSRYSGQHLRCPAFDNTEAWVDWLLALGRKGPRRAIYATSDAVSFAIAKHRAAISEYFHLYEPELDSTISILDKGRMIEHAQAVGFDTPQTWLPRSRKEVEQIAADLEGDVLIKPRSQLSVCSNSKGAMVSGGASEILHEFDRLVRFGAHDQEFARLYPECMVPMLQRYHREALDGIYSLSGFRDATGKHVCLLGSRKVLQRPRRLGIGLCFEESEVDRDLAERTLRLCERIGYFGAFELEFISVGGRDLLIDFNGRFYNQMVFDMARGLDIAGLVYAGAIGNDTQVAELVARANSANRQSFAFCNSFGLEFTIGAQRLFGTMSREEAQHWRNWVKQPGRRVVDAVRDPGDPLPSKVDATLQLWRCVRHPRTFVRQYGLDAVQQTDEKELRS